MFRYIHGTKFGIPPGHDLIDRYYWVMLMAIWHHIAAALSTLVGCFCSIDGIISLCMSINMYTYVHVYVTCLCAC